MDDGIGGGTIEGENTDEGAIEGDGEQLVALPLPNVIVWVHSPESNI